jgi:SulP family sulfate permease
VFAQGLANLVCGLFQAMGGDAMIGQSTINIMNGARHRVSSTMSGVFMLLFTLVLSPFIKLLPIATLTGVLFIVVLSTFQWKTFVILRYGRLSDSAAIVLVTVVAVFTNLAIAIAAGIILSALVHAWDSGAHVETDVEVKDMMINGKRVNDVKYVHVRGSIFFSSTRKFVNMFNIGEDPDVVVLDFKDAIIIDHSAVAAIQGLSHRYALAGKRVVIMNVQAKCIGRMQRTHGDLDKIHLQMSHHVADLENQEEDGEVSVENVVGTVSHEHESKGLQNEAHLQNLKMFETDVDGIDAELSKLVATNSADVQEIVPDKTE